MLLHQRIKTMHNSAATTNSPQLATQPDVIAQTQQAAAPLIVKFIPSSNSASISAVQAQRLMRQADLFVANKLKTKRSVLAERLIRLKTRITHRTLAQVKNNNAKNIVA